MILIYDIAICNKLFFIRPCPAIQKDQLSNIWFETRSISNQWVKNVCREGSEETLQMQSNLKTYHNRHLSANYKTHFVNMPQFITMSTKMILLGASH